MKLFCSSPMLSQQSS